MYNPNTQQSMSDADMANNAASMGMSVADFGQYLYQNGWQWAVTPLPVNARPVGYPDSWAAPPDPSTIPAGYTLLIYTVNPAVWWVMWTPLTQKLALKTDQWGLNETGQNPALAIPGSGYWTDSIQYANGAAIWVYPVDAVPTGHALPPPTAQSVPEVTGTQPVTSTAPTAPTAPSAPQTPLTAQPVPEITGGGSGAVAAPSTPSNPFGDVLSWLTGKQTMQAPAQLAPGSPDEESAIAAPVQASVAPGLDLKSVLPAVSLIAAFIFGKK